MQYNIKFHHISIRFKDVDAAAEFFINKLGFKEISNLITKKRKRIIFIRKGGLIMELFQTYNIISNAGFLKVLAFSVSDIKKSVSKMKNNGLIFIENIKKSKDNNAKYFYFTYFLGPENIKLCLYQEIKKK